MLGPLEVRDDAGSALEVSGARLRALLTLLALRPGQIVPASYLIDELWGERLPADAPNALQALVSRLRRAVPEAAVVSRPAGYRLALDAERVDVFRFERLAAQGHARLHDDPAAAAGTLTEALALWRGPALADAAATESGRAAIARLGELRLAATEDRIDAELRLAAGGDPPHGAPGPALVAELEGLLAASPTRETLAGLLMRALVAAGRRGAALQAYEQVRERLADELGADPSPTLAALHLEILRTDGAAPAALPAHTADPVLAPRTNLPAGLTSFVGREAELGRVAILLREHRLVTLTGPGGAGKTRLAVEAARAALGGAGALPGGAWLAELAPVTDPREVTQAVLLAFGLREQALVPVARTVPGGDGRTGDASADPLDRLTAALAGRQALLVLDNCEHLIGAAATLADRVLARCPRMRVLATSREPLNITGEVLWPVGPLAASPAVQLFTERARAVCPGFQVSQGNADAVQDICRALDGMPLAIELAAARARTMTPGQIASRLDDRFRLLTGGSRTAMPRHQTLRAVVDWSWDLLAEPERAMLRRLSAFTGGATVAAAERVCAAPPVPERDVLDLLTALADKSLLTVRQAEDGPRYGMLEIIKAYAAERLTEAGEQETLRRGHAAYFLEFAAPTQRLLLGAGQLDWMRRLDADAGNVHAAIRAAVAAGDADTATGLVGEFGWYWWLRSMKKEGGDLAEETLGLVGALPDEARKRISPARLALAYAMGGVVTFDTPRLPAAVDWLRTATRLGAQAGGEDYPVLRLAAPLAALIAEPGMAAHDVFDVVINDPDPWVGAMARVLRGQVALNLGGQIGSAEADSRAALAAFTELGERWGMAVSLSALAMLAGWRGEFTAAIADLERAVALAAELGTTEDQVQFRALLARVLWLAGGGQRERSRAELARAVREAEELGWPWVTGFAAWTAGDLARLDGDPAAARAHLGRAAEIAALPGLAAQLRALTDTALGYLAGADGDLGAARAYHEGALRAALPTRDSPVVAAAVAGLADVCLREGDAAWAAMLLGASEGVRGGPDRSVPDEERVAAAARSALTSAEYGAAFQRGRRVVLATLDQVLTPGA